jgi:periplasmic copper chaperone A
LAGYFPVVQECAGGAAERWIEIPAPPRHDVEETLAPGLKIAADAGGR